MGAVELRRGAAGACDGSGTWAATHPAAMLEHGENLSTKATSPDAEALFQMLAAEADEDRE